MAVIIKAHMNCEAPANDRTVRQFQAALFATLSVAGVRLGAAPSASSARRKASQTGKWRRTASPAEDETSQSLPERSQPAPTAAWDGGRYSREARPRM